jgi:hypothetical protein
MPKDGSSALFTRNPYDYRSRCTRPESICENIKSLGWSNAFDALLSRRQTADADRVYKESLSEDYHAWRADIKIVGRVKARQSFIEGFERGLRDLEGINLAGKP